MRVESVVGRSAGPHFEVPAFTFPLSPLSTAPTIRSERSPLTLLHHVTWQCNPGTRHEPSPKHVPMHAGSVFGCFKKAIARGPGTPLPACPMAYPNRQGKFPDDLYHWNLSTAPTLLRCLGSKCYPTCKAGFSNYLGLCIQKCPSGFSDQGSQCMRIGRRHLGKGGIHPFYIIAIAWCKRIAMVTDIATMCEGINTCGPCPSGYIAGPGCFCGPKW